MAFFIHASFVHYKVTVFRRSRVEEFVLDAVNCER